MVRAILFTTLLLFVGGRSDVAPGKGLKDLQPSEGGEDLEKSLAPETPPVAAPKPEATESEEEGADEEGEEAPPAEVVKEPSETSKLMADRLMFVSGMGWGFGGFATGTTGVRGVASFGVLFDPHFPAPLAPLWYQARYLPIEFNTLRNETSWRGVEEVFLVGGQWRKAVKSGLVAWGSLELGYATVRFKNIEPVETDTDLPRGGAAAEAGAGLDWNVLEKVHLGPRIYYIYAPLSIVEVSGGASFIF